MQGERMANDLETPRLTTAGQWHTNYPGSRAYGFLWVFFRIFF